MWGQEYRLVIILSLTIVYKKEQHTAEKAFFTHKIFTCIVYATPYFLGLQILEKRGGLYMGKYGTSSENVLSLNLSNKRNLAANLLSANVSQPASDNSLVTLAFLP